MASRRRIRRKARRRVAPLTPRDHDDTRPKGLPRLQGRCPARRVQTRPHQRCRRSTTLRDVLDRWRGKRFLTVSTPGLGGMDKYRAYVTVTDNARCGARMAAPQTPSCQAEGPPRAHVQDYRATSTLAIEKGIEAHGARAMGLDRRLDRGGMWRRRWDGRDAGGPEPFGDAPSRLE